MTDVAKKTMYSWIEWASRGLLVWILVSILSFQKSQAEILSKLERNTSDIAALQGEIAQIKGQMVGWDTLKRVELLLAQLSTKGKGNEAMVAVAGAIRIERESREKN